MQTLLQTLLIETLPAETDPILRSFVNTVLPAMEQEFGLISALGGSEEAHYQTLVKQGDSYAREKAQRWANKADQSLLVHVLNALMTAWNLSQHLAKHLQLSEIEKRLLCLGLTLHDYNKYVQGQGEETPPPKAHEIPAIIELCQELGEKLNFQDFWADWQQYLLEIAFLAQNTQFNVGINTVFSNWETDGREFTLDELRLDLPLRHLLAFGDVAVHMNDPADVVTKTGGDRLQDHLDLLGIRKKLVYHRLRDCRGLLTNQIHNAVVHFAHEIGWEPILYFAQGVVYLAPQNNDKLNLLELMQFVWQQISTLLGSRLLSGDIGFKRSKEGLKIANETLNLLLNIFTPSELISQFPDVVRILVNNVKAPERLEKLVEKSIITNVEKEALDRDTSSRTDRLAEFIILIQSQFFKGSVEYASYILAELKLEDKISTEQARTESGGVKYGWYYAAACYVTSHPTLSDDELLEKIVQLSQGIIAWAESNFLLPKKSNKTRDDFFEYVGKYLEVTGCEIQQISFESELGRYTTTKVNNKPICSLSSGEFTAEKQSETVVLFQPQLYSNKNRLGGTELRRGISTIWFLEMLFRKAIWTIQTGKVVKTGKEFEKQKPVFLYMFPAYVYSPQTAAAVRSLVNKLRSVNLLDVRKYWIDFGMNYKGLQKLSWLIDDEPEEGRFGDREDKFSRSDLPFMAAIPLTPQKSNPTITDAWIEPALLALALPMLLGVKVVATNSPEPPYVCDSDFHESVILDAPAGFWSLLGLPTSLRLQELSKALNRLLIAYSLHLDVPWKDLNDVVQSITTNTLDIFSIGEQRMRRKTSNKKGNQSPSSDDVKIYWKYAQLWIISYEKGDECMNLIEKLVQEYRIFYRVGEDELGNVYRSESSHSILRPISIALDVILCSPDQVNAEYLVVTGAGELRAFLERVKSYNRPMRKEQDQELTAIRTFMNTCVKELLGDLYKNDRALLQENRNRIKSGAEFAYRWLALQEKQSQPEKNESEGEAE